MYTTGNSLTFVFDELEVINDFIYSSFDTYLSCDTVSPFGSFFAPALLSFDGHFEGFGSSQAVSQIILAVMVSYNMGVDLPGEALNGKYFIRCQPQQAAQEFRMCDMPVLQVSCRPDYVMLLAIDLILIA